MKQSYYQTPRTTKECTYHDWADPIEVTQANQGTGIDPDSVVVGFCIAGFIFMVVWLLAGH